MIVTVLYYSGLADLIIDFIFGNTEVTNSIEFSQIFGDLK